MGKWRNILDKRQSRPWNDCRAYAPELYDTLRVVMESIDAQGNNWGDALPSKNWHWYKHARELLARIEGEQE